MRSFGCLTRSCLQKYSLSTSRVAIRRDIPARSTNREKGVGKYFLSYVSEHAIFFFRNGETCEGEIFDLG